MRRLTLFALLAAGLAACPPPPGPDAGTDAGTDGADAGLMHCLDRPDELGRLPNGQLPCELLPPGFKQ